MKYFKIILSVLIAQLLGITDISAQVKIARRYLLQGGKGAETTMTLIGDITDTVPINYYLSYNVCVSENVWMIHCVPWTDFEVILPYDAKVLFKTFKGNVIELKASTKKMARGDSIVNWIRKYIKNTFLVCIVSYQVTN